MSKASRSGATKAAILNAARERFACDGYERATIRAIAAQANIDPAMVMRYFASKEGLFAEAARFDLKLPDLRGLGAEELGPLLAGHFFDLWEGDDTFLALLRAAVSNQAAAERMRSVLAQQVVPALGAGLGERAGLLASHFLGLALGRYVLKMPPVATMERSEFVSRVGPVVTFLLS